MNKAALLAELATIYTSVETPEPKATVSNVTPYTVTVFETGLSESTKKPVGYKKNISFYVKDEGQAGETAYYGITEPTNGVNKDVSISTSSYEAIGSLYASQALRSRVLVAVITQCSTVFQEAANTTNHANRMKLVSAANTDINNVVSRFMSAIALNATVQSQGNAVADSVLQSIVTGAWDAYASLIVA